MNRVTGFGSVSGAGIGGIGRDLTSSFGTSVVWLRQFNIVIRFDLKRCTTHCFSIIIVPDQLVHQ